MMPIKKILIVGNGNWGSTVYDLLTSPERHPEGVPDRDVKIYGPEMDGKKILTYGTGVAKWPDSALRDCEDADLIIFAVASKFMRDTVRAFAQYNPRHDTVLLNLAKGIVYDPDEKEIYLMHEILRDEFPEHKNIASLAGANIAREVRHKPPRLTTTKIATLKKDSKFHKTLNELFSVEMFSVRQDPSEDILSLELGSAMKNPIAFGSGVIHGYYEEEARQAGSDNPKRDSMMCNVIGDYIDVASQEGEYIFHMISGVKGMRRRIPYSVLGDLITTSISDNSRNFRAGYMRGVAQQKGEKKSIEEICQEIGQAVESVTTVNSLKDYFEHNGWQDRFIIFNNIYLIMHDLINFQDAAKTLAQGHPRVSRLQAMMEARAHRNHTRQIKKEKQ